jgi:hypothetical protein
MSNKRHRSPSHSCNPVSGNEAPPRIVAMSLAEELSAAVKADAREHQDLVDAALAVGQWLADQGLPGRWDRVHPAAVLRCLDFLPLPERERFLFSLVGLLGHAGLLARIPPLDAKRAIDEAAALTGEEAIRAFARTTAAQLARLADPPRHPVA